VSFTPAGEAGKYEGESISLKLFGSYRITEQFYLEGSVGYASIERDSGALSLSSYIHAVFTPQIKYTTYPYTYRYRLSFVTRLL
jgi:hypothetical protein